MAKSRYSVKKRKKEFERKQKQEQKRQRKLDRARKRSEGNPSEFQNEVIKLES